MKAAYPLTMLALAGLLAGCGREDLLTGERLDLRALEAPAEAEAEAGEAAAVPEVPEGTARSPDAPANRAEPIALPAAQANGSWTHRNGSPAHRVPHPALSAAPQRVWGTDIGAGNSRRERITADPIVADGRIFTLDAGAGVTAVSTAGAVLWRQDLTPASDRGGDASGGGIAYGDGRVFVTSGFGTVTALDPASGAVAWTQKLDAAATGAPTVADGVVYLSARDGRAWAIRADTGRVEWEVAATPSPSGVLAGAGPAVTGDLAIFPFASGELVAVNRATGVRTWSAFVAGKRRGLVYATISDITGDPVADDGRIYVANQSGRAVALDAATGERLWIAREGAYSPLWPEGGSLFMVTDQSELVRLDAATGERIWGVELPYFDTDRERRRKAVYGSYGPVLAGGRVWVASGDGTLRGFDPRDGTLVHSTGIPGGAAANPAVAGGVMYVVGAGGQLHAFR